MEILLWQFLSNAYVKYFFTVTGTHSEAEAEAETEDRFYTAALDGRYLSLM
jgi:hypothetical protein